MKFISHTKTLLASLAIAAFAGGAQADVVTVTTHSVNGTIYARTAMSPANPGNVAAMWSANNATSNTSFLAFCIEIAQEITQGSQVNYNAAAYTASAGVQELYDRFYGTVLQSRDQAVGFQLALWELIGDANVATFQSPVDAIKVANTMLDTVRNGTSDYQANGYTFVKWSNSNAQDVLEAVAVQAVPEPASQALMLSGLGLMALAVRARRRKSGSNGQ